MKNIEVVKSTLEATATIVAAKAAQMHPDDIASKSKEVYGALIDAINDAIVAESAPRVDQANPAQ